MPDYSKLNIRASNLGLNLAHSASSLNFGQFTKLKNAWTEIEGQLTVRRGFGIESTLNAASGAIIGFRKLNNSVNGWSTFVTRTSNGKLFVTYTGVSGTATTTPPFYLIDTTFAGISSSFGSLLIERPSLSAAAWCYVGDKSTMYKVTIDATGHVQGKSVGMRRPIGPPTFVVNSGGSLTASSTYNYRYTLYDKNTGTESLFNSTEATAASTTGTNKSITVTIPTETVNSATTHVRVYRQGGTLATWNRISDDSATYAYTGTTINFADSASDLSITNSTLLDTISDQPFSTTQTDTTVIAGQPLPYLFGPYLGYVLACGDPNNPGFVYWANKYNPDSQNPANNIEVSSPQDPLQNGFVYNGLGYVFSKEALYSLYPGLSESTFTPSKTTCTRGLWAPWAFTVGAQVYFLSKDGLYATSGGLEQALTDNELRPLFDPDQTATTINGIGVVDYTQTSYMFMTFYKNEVYFQYLGKDANTHILIFDVRYHRWRHLQGGVNAGVNVRSMYVEEQAVANLMLGGNDGHLYQDTGANDGGANIAVDIKTGLLTFGSPLIHKQFGSMVLDIDPNNALVTINAFSARGATLIDSGSGYTAQTSAASRTRLFVNLNDTFSEDLQLDFSWSSSTAKPIIYGYELLYKTDVTQINSWKLVGTNHGILGWQILRSGYFTYRSDGTLLLTVDVEGISRTYTLPTSSNNKVKTFIPFDPLKGKLFSYTIITSSATYFRFYPDESEVHVKPWISSFGYSAVNPFRGGGDMPNFIAEGQGQGSPTLTGDGGGGGGAAPFSAGGIIPGFDFSGLGGGIALGPGSTAVPTSETIGQDQERPTRDDRRSDRG